MTRLTIILCLALAIVYVKADWRSDANQRIQQNRMVNINVK